MDTSLDMLKELLKREIGLDTSTIGESSIKKFLGQRMRACNLTDIDDYYKRLNSDRNELSAFLETAVIPETWFFRDIRPFTLILNAMKTSPLKYSNHPCNILSIPCSTGEEPYSIAMYLLQSGIPASSFRIKAVDISQRALDIATQGYYGNNSFRGRTEQQYMDGFFSYSHNQYRINDRVRQCISFERVNILDAGTLPYDQHFDFVLCRNLLIYFDVPTKITAFSNLHRILKDNGILFIGHSEFGAIPQNLFINTGSANAFGLKKFRPPAEARPAPAHVLPPETATGQTADPEKNNPAPAKKAFSAFIPSNVTAQSAADKEPVADSTGFLDRAQQLADEGNLSEAEKLCLQHIDEHGENRDSFFLLALINESSGKENMAETFYRKAIYLDPKHYPSLIHLALLLEKNGDSKAAGLLRQRAERASKN